MDSEDKSFSSLPDWELFPYAPINVAKASEDVSTNPSRLLMDPVISIQYRLEGFYTLAELESLAKDPFIDQAIRLLIDNKCFNLTQISSSVIDSPGADRDELESKFVSGGDGGLSPPLSNEQGS
jgi:hypothetical protein